MRTILMLQNTQLLTSTIFDAKKYIIINNQKKLIDAKRYKNVNEDFFLD